MARDEGNINTCMNAACGVAAAAGEWKKGWELRSGGFANLCDNCGCAYEQLTFCDTFHLKESGWRECNSCGRRLHCGCIVSKYLVELLDSGGVQCNSCTKNSELSSIPRDVHDSLSEPAHMVLSLSTQNPKDGNTNDFGASMAGNACDLQFASTDGKKGHDVIPKGNPMHTGKSIGDNMQSCVFYTQIDGTNGSLGHIKREQVTLSVGDAVTHNFSNKSRSPIGSSQTLRQDNMKDNNYNKGMHESLSQESLNISLGTSNPGNMVEACYGTGNSLFAQPLPNVVAEGREQNKALSALHKAQRARHLLPKPPKAGLGSETSKEVLSHMRVARPPAEGRGRSQLLPRYWPRITDQELQQISGDSNSTIVPLFEKVLSASDAGRIGRLVLPKACAEAYFPPISQPEGLPLKIQDAKGKDWIFQFRFWPNNNSRMYVLEGVTPCIQSMQLQAGDTVTFSRIDPEGKLVMGFRKATNSVPLQDSQISAIANGALVSESLLSGVIENLPIVSGYPGFFQSLKGSADPHLSALSELNLSDGDICWSQTDKHRIRPIEGLPLQPLLVPEKKRSRNIGSKSKRLLMDTEDAMELRLTWEEVQDLLRPSPSSKPSIVIIEDHEFEEYDEPPVFGKRTFFTAQTSGCNDQWVQCDNCCKWRRLPVDVLLPSKWTCTDNTWDPKRSSCSVPDEMSQKELQNLLHQNADFRKRRSVASYKLSPLEQEASALDTLATAATLGDDVNTTTPYVATTTKHPRHRVGCTCIVCIQPPSGKGPKHMPTCTCNVCLTVKRRFQTLMMRKKKRQSEREEAETHKKLDMEADSSLKGLLPLDLTSQTDLDSGYSRIIAEKPELDKGNIDLNCHPEREENPQAGPAHLSMMGLLHVASLPLETYLKQNGLTSLVCEQQASSSSHALPQAPAESEGRTADESYLASVTQERDSGAVDEGHCGSNQAQNDPV